MYYKDSSALSPNSKQAIDAILAKEGNIQDFFDDRFSSFHQKEILFFIRDFVDSDSKTTKDFNLVLKNLSLTSDVLASQPKTLLQLITHKPAFAESCVEILRDSQSLDDKTLIIPLLEAAQSKNLPEEDFARLSNQLLVSCQSSEILSEVQEYALRHSFDEQSKAFVHFYLNAHTGNSQIIDETLDFMSTIEKNVKTRKIGNQKLLHEFLRDKEENKNLFEIDLSNEETEACILFLQKTIKGTEEPEQQTPTTVRNVALDLIALGVDFPELKNEIVEMLEKMKNQKHFVTCAQDFIDISTRYPEFIVPLLAKHKQDDSLGASALASLPIVAQFDETYKPDFFNTMAKSLRDSKFYHATRQIFNHTGLIEDETGNRVYVNLFDKHFAYLIKTALYESKMAPHEATALADDIRMNMENKLSRLHKTNDITSKELKSFGRFLQTVDNSPLINQNLEVKDLFLASTLIASETVNLPVELHKNMNKFLESHDINNESFIKALVKKTRNYEKLYHPKMNNCEPAKLYEKMFTYIEGILEKTSFSDEEKKRITGSLDTLTDTNVIFSRKKFQKMLNSLNKTSTANNIPPYSPNFKKGRSL
ncbi:MAG: hypothetical protein PHE89_03720 [Alphaproteobacteria bacterium]|nr:hypothetical protein [Alphaproteobacteria bacterium]